MVQHLQSASVICHINKMQDKNHDYLNRSCTKFNCHVNLLYLMSFIMTFFKVHRTDILSGVPKLVFSDISSWLYSASDCNIMIINRSRFISLSLSFSHSLYLCISLFLFLYTKLFIWILFPSVMFFIGLTGFTFFLLSSVLANKLQTLFFLFV